ncbi:hypothetical protein BDV98DRAFT_596903 [Pterulicium gracile]|uniref:Uncharacterized protein n=1 Tax=Pterulicium gracile TaxID=1884261 RepID=A0A5C3Q5M2_9AGAR|nr:hypothetical protein BDV98DRAFT_596903 [Pterula gracilis]
MPRLFHCSCDRTDPFIASAHQSIGSKTPRSTVEAPVDSCAELELCELLFSIIDKIIRLPLSATKLARLSAQTTSNSIKGKDKAYTVLAHYFVVEPALILESSSSWFRKTRSLCVISFLSANAVPRYPADKTEPLMCPVFYSVPECFFELLITIMQILSPSLHSTLASRSWSVTSTSSRYRNDGSCEGLVTLIGALLDTAVWRDGLWLAPETVPSHLLREVYDVLREDII